jgi:hypothetical protein
MSLDEEYLACLVECVRVGSANSHAMRREKIIRILQDKPRLALRLKAAFREGESSTLWWKPEWPRVNRVVLKLARGHAAYECGESPLASPKTISVAPMALLTPDEIASFEAVPAETVFPEIGSRAFNETLISNNEVFLQLGWRVVQQDQYRYLVSYSHGMHVRIVLGEYLACEICW